MAEESTLPAVPVVRLNDVMPACVSIISLISEHELDVRDALVLQPSR